MSSDPSHPAGTGPQNRLAKESSPYLRQHASNPVDWYPWGPEALDRARAERKPILLSVGYSACHWCHVMAHESFENPDIAKLMNEFFINIKVDREERPDIDQIYQGVVLLMGRGGGWPLTVFLTPELKPFFGGTYFPPLDKFGIPGFPKLLKALHEAWTTKPEEVASQAAQFQAGLEHLAAYGLDSPPSDVTVRDVVMAGYKLEREIDRTHGGFGSAPKFPNPMNVALLLRAFRRSGTASLLSGVTLTLEKMASGGIYDQLGGGFHRYSVDERWLVPHFEKMLYDNAQLIHLYAEAHQIDARPLWGRVVEETVDYVRREMTSPQGGFYATQDADSEGVEGKFFVWTPQEIDALLTPKQAEIIKLRFNVTDAGNFEHQTTVLEAKKDIAELALRLSLPPEQVEAELAAARKTLFAAREKRVKPGRDEKIIAGWNGLMIRGLALAARAFQRPEWAQLARGAADFVLGTLWKDGRLSRVHQDGVSKIDAFLEDYGDLAAGLAALYQATFEPKYIDAAEALVAKASELFWDAERQAYLSAPRGQKDLITANFALHDNAFPSGASTLTEAQVALAALTGKPAYLEQAGKYIRKMRDEMVRNPFGYGHLLLAADSWLEGAADVTVVGPDRAQVQSLVDVVNAAYAPTVTIVAHVAGEPVPDAIKDQLAGKEPTGGKAAAYLCRHFSCEAPLTEPAELKVRLARMAAVPVTEFPKG